MRTLTLKPGDTFAENECDPPRWIVADVFNGQVTLKQRTHPDETIGDLRAKALEDRAARMGRNSRDVESRGRRKNIAS